MALPRPLLFALLGVALIAATLTATRVAGQGDDAGAPRAQRTAAPPPAKKRSSAEAPRGSAGKSRRASGTRARESRASARGRPASADSRPEQAAVARAIARRRVVVLFLFQRRGLDDRATAASVAAVRRLRGTRVFTDRVEHVARYGPIVSEVGVSQVPSVVIVGRDRKARLVEGYVDAETLSQDVLDAR